MQIIFKKKRYKNANGTLATDKTFYIDEGSTITENYNETLDSAEIRLSHLTAKLDIEPFDKVILRDEEGRLNDRYMCVDTYTETMESLDPILYSYQISLFSETKELENVLLPNLGITQLRTSKRKVWWYLNTYLELYGPKIRKDSNLVNPVDKYQFKTYHENTTVTLEQKFNVECPEMQWNCPTLREVFTNLMMVVDCIPVLRNGYIDYIDLTELKNSIDTTKVNYIQSSQSSEDYVSELKMDMLNVMQTSVDGVKHTVNTVENLTFKAEGSGYVITSENLVLKTQHPILEVKHLWMSFQTILVYDPDGNSGNEALLAAYKVDLCGLNVIGKNNPVRVLYEETEFNVLPVMYGNPRSFTGDTIYQNQAIYFARGSNEIKGFSQLTKTYWQISNKCSALNNIKIGIAKNCYTISGFNAGDEAEYSENQMESKLEAENVYFSTFFEIEYVTTADSVFKASKNIAPTHERVIADNQTYSFVDAYNQGFMEYQKANRLGNKQLFINARYEDDYGSIVKIGDYYEDNIIYQTQYQIYKNHIEVNATATKNYILRDYFTGVKARIRSWNYAPASESFTRHDLEKYYLEFSKTQKTERFTPTQYISSYFLTPLKECEITPMKYAFVSTIDSDYNEYPSYNNESFCVDLTSRMIGNSVVFNFGFDDNFTAGRRVSKRLKTSDVRANKAGVSLSIPQWHLSSIYINNFTEDYGGIPLEDTQYVDYDGEFVTFGYTLTNGVDNPNAANGDSSQTTGVNDKSKFFLYRVSKLPVIDDELYEDYVKISGTKIIYKDNKEITKLSLQYEFCSDTPEIVFTKKFIQLQQCIRELTESEKITQHGSFNATISPSDFVPLGGSHNISVTVIPPLNGIFDNVDPYYGKNYSIEISSLEGETLSTLSISNTYTGRNNTVNFDNEYTYIDPIIGEVTTARFYGDIYSETDTNTTATITYTVDGEEDPYWVYSGTFNVGLSARITVRNVSFTVSGYTLSSRDNARVSFDSETNQMVVYMRLYTQPSSNITVSVTYDYNLVEGNTVLNATKIYRSNIVSDLDLRNPTLNGADLLATSQLVLTDLNKTTTRLSITNASSPSQSVYYITDINNNILLAVKGASTFYLNLLLSRDYNVYNAQGEIVGDILDI